MATIEDYGWPPLWIRPDGTDLMVRMKDGGGLFLGKCLGESLKLIGKQRFTPVPYAVSAGMDSQSADSPAPSPLAGEGW